MTNDQKKTLTAIAKHAIDTDWNIAFKGKSKGNNHLNRVNKIAFFLQKKEGGDEFITLAGAWVHDVTLAFEIDDEPQVIYQRTSEFLKQFDLQPSIIHEIATVVSNHETGKVPSIEAKIVHDADVIDKSGMLGVIRHIWKMTNMIHNRIIQSEDDLLELKHHLANRTEKVGTPTAKKIIRDLNIYQKLFFNDQKYLDIVTFISQQAQAGLISDKIAEKLILKYHSPFTDGLKNQLECSYLLNEGK